MLSGHVLKIIDRICMMLVYLSVGMYLWELSYDATDSLASPIWFLWTERVVASIFILEYLLRIREGGKKYVFSMVGLIDLLAWLPFAAGFFVPPSWLGWVRTMRMLRLLKLFRYCRRLQLVLLAFYRALDFLKTLAFMTAIVCLFSSVVLYQIEPETFGHKIGNAIWYTIVTASTVGYGDIYPVSMVGKMLSLLLLLLPAVAVFAGAIGVVGNKVTEVLDEEKDPDIDPIAMFAAEREKKRVARALRSKR